MTMNIEQYLDKIKKIQENFLEFLENVENVEENLNNLRIEIENIKIRDNKHDLSLFLHFISSICDNYCRDITFISKIKRTLQLFKDDFKKFYSNSEIFNIFKKNKQILLFLIKEEIMTFDKSIAKKIGGYEFSQKYYPQYFFPELKPFMNEKLFPKNELTEELPDRFNEMRDKGENGSFICKLIREDLVEEFIAYINRNNISVNSTINPSIYETNSFLLEKQIQSMNGITLIEYAAFFGSIQIFTFLKNEKAELTSSLWLCAIHSKNAELIHLIEELYINKTDEELYKQCFKESIRCHHNDIANYFINNYLDDKDINSDDTFIQSLKYYNFAFLQNERINESSFCHLCNFDYYSFVKFLLAGKEVDANSKTVQIYIFL